MRFKRLNEDVSISEMLDRAEKTVKYYDKLIRDTTKELNSKISKHSDTIFVDDVMKLCRQLKHYTQIYNMVSIYRSRLYQNTDSDKSLNDIKNEVINVSLQYTVNINGTLEELKEYEKIARDITGYIRK